MINKKLSCGFEMPALGIGTYSFGGEYERDESRKDEWIQAIKDAIELGYTHIDTAEIYGAVFTEELVAEAIRGVDRSKLFLTSKVWPTNFSYDSVLESAKASLKRLNTTYLDLYLLHSFNPNIPLSETMRAMNELVDKGLVKHVGVCNFTAKQLLDAQKVSKAKIVVNQMKHSLWVKNKPDIETFKFCQENDILITAYKIFGRNKINNDKIDLLEEMSKKYELSVHQLMIAWVLSKKNFTTIFTSMHKDHLKSNLDALNVRITSDDVALLDEELLINRFN
ncbi:aldo/keto reductase [Candidatus Woesearchaeota archaeon]|nr:aldo/keto reductase [Candidatus Woesearchaeota archaeon]